MENKYYSTDSIQKGIVNFIDNDLIPSIPASNIKRGFMGAILAVFIKKLDVILKNISSNETVKMLDIVNDNGDYDIETLFSGFISQMPKTGYKVSIDALSLSFNISVDDVDKLYEYIKEQEA